MCRKVIKECKDTSSYFFDYICQHINLIIITTMTKMNQFSADESLPTQMGNSFKSRISDKWDPNVPLDVSQEEFWEHIHEIERGSFTSLDEGFKNFELWKKELLKSRL